MEYSDFHRQLQDRFGTRRLADRLAETSGDDLTPFRAFIEARDMFFISTVDSEGNPQCSYKGGDPGFVQVIDESTLAFPVYDGNGMFLTVGNLADNPAVGLLFISFEDGSRLRVNGVASIDADDSADRHHPGRAAGRSCAYTCRVPELSPLCPHQPRSTALGVRPGRKHTAAGAGLEARSMVRRDAATGRPCSRSGQPERTLHPSLLTV